MNHDIPGAIIFASGVSDSQETNNDKFQREQDLLESKLGSKENKTFVYISTSSINDPSQVSSPYVNHKIAMERIVLSHPRASVVRVPNVVGPTGNKRHLVNYLTCSVLEGSKINVQESARRYLLGVDEMSRLIAAYAAHQPDEGQIIEFAPPTSTSVLQIVRMIEDILERKSLVKLVVGGSSYAIDFSATAHYSKLAGVELGRGYPEYVLKTWLPEIVKVLQAPS